METQTFELVGNTELAEQNQQRIAKIEAVIKVVREQEEELEVKSRLLNDQGRAIRESRYEQIERINLSNRKAYEFATQMEAKERFDKAIAEIKLEVLGEQNYQYTKNNIVFVNIDNLICSYHYGSIEISSDGTNRLLKFSTDRRQIEKNQKILKLAVDFCKNIEVHTQAAKDEYAKQNSLTIIKEHQKDGIWTILAKRREQYQVSEMNMSASEKHGDDYETNGFTIGCWQSRKGFFKEYSGLKSAEKRYSDLTGVTA
jgi:hypothetical protein